MPPASPPSSPRRRRRRIDETPQPPPTEARDWAELPRDAVATVWRSAGRGEAFQAERVADNRILFYLANWMSCLKSLCLISCYSVSSEGFIDAIQGFPLLEKLELSLCKNIFGEAIEAAGKACPHMKRFRLSNDRFYSFEDEYINDQEAYGISTMHELRSLQLFANNLTNKGLAAILDNCPYLECLDIRHCFNVQLDASLKAKCSSIKTLRLPNDITDDYEFDVKSPIRMNSNVDSHSDGGDWGPFKSDGDWKTYGPFNSDGNMLDDFDKLRMMMLMNREPSIRMEEPGDISEDEDA